jgi:hypothetical protein
MAGVGFSVFAQENATTSVEGAGVGAVICDGRFANVDVDGDGFVNREEATRGIEQGFGAIDADGNGEITKTEYVDCKAQSRNQQTAEITRDAESFAAADANKDQGVDRGEYMGAAQQAYENASDASGAGPSSGYLWLTPDELEAGGAKNLSADEAGARSAMSFDALDNNGDGILDTQEWEKAIPGGGNPGGAPTARFEMIDSDQSNSLSKEEYSQARTAMLDEMQTGSISADSATANQQGSDASASSGQSDTAPVAGVPVFIYRFMTF